MRKRTNFTASRAEFSEYEVLPEQNRQVLRPGHHLAVQQGTETEIRTITIWNKMQVHISSSNLAFNMNSYLWKLSREYSDAATPQRKTQNCRQTA
jgi:hypothetical protein